MKPPGDPAPPNRRASVAIDLGAESCRVSLLQWHGDQPEITVVHRIPNGPVHHLNSHYWPLENIVAGIEEGLEKAAGVVREPIASIAVDGWAVDYVRLDQDGQPARDPFCYRDERTIASKERADAILPPEVAFRRTGAQPLRINTVYQLLADDPRVAGFRWVCLPEYILYRLGAPRVAEYTNATHTGLVDPVTRTWAGDVFDKLGLSTEAAPRMVAPGTRLGCMTGSLSDLAPYHGTELIAPACHDTASAIAGISADLDSTAYICSGTWSLVGTLIEHPITTPEALAARYTNQGAASGGFCFHTNVNGMWLLKQCMESWSVAGRSWTVSELVKRASECPDSSAIIDVDVESLLLAGDMPGRINRELGRVGHPPIPDIAGNEPLFARLIFESLAARYASALVSLESMLGRKLNRVHIIGGASRNQLLSELTSRRSGIPADCGHPESSTIGNLAVQLAVMDSPEGPVPRASVRKWARNLSRADFQSSP